MQSCVAWCCVNFLGVNFIFVYQILTLWKSLWKLVIMLHLLLGGDWKDLFVVLLLFMWFFLFSGISLFSMGGMMQVIQESFW